MHLFYPGAQWAEIGPEGGYILDDHQLTAEPRLGIENHSHSFTIRVLRLTSSPEHACLWTERGRRTLREPTVMLGGHADSTQKGH